MSFNKIVHIIGCAAVVVGGLATGGILPAVVIPIAGGVGVIAAYLAANPITDATSAATAAAKLAQVAQDTQAALHKGGQK